MANTIGNNSGRRVLATDLDGTLIPLPEVPSNRRDLKTLADELKRDGATLIFVTGRHFESVTAAMDEFDLPRPDGIICDVGTSIFEQCRHDEFRLVPAYQQRLAKRIAPFPKKHLETLLADVAGLRRQEEKKQGPFKLSYYADAAQLDELVGQIQRRLDERSAPYSIIHSVDPFNGDGLIDLLPMGVSKAYALAWWVEHAGLHPESVVFAGDSGNDLAALTAGYRAIVVANADRALAEQVAQLHRQAGWRNRLVLADQPATGGVLEGWRRFRTR